MTLSRILIGAASLDAPADRSGSALVESVREILAAVRDAVDRRDCVKAYARRFDARNQDEFELFVEPDEIEAAHLGARQHDAIREAIRRVRLFHEAQLEAVTTGMHRRGPVFEWSIPASTGSIGRIGQRLAPVRYAGVYVPGGRATYPSSLIMNAVPALVAGVERIVVATPPRPDGSVSDAILVVARELGLSRILKAGGAYGIAALAFGLGPAIPPCDVIAGPGNQYVNEAKRQLWGQVGLDLYAGPSEVAVYVDATSDPAFAAADLLTQVEHAEDNVAYLISLDRAMLQRVLGEVESQLAGAPREATMRAALAELGVGVIVETEEEAAEAIDRIAPEHLSLLGGDPEGMADLVRNAGAVLLGPYAAQSAGDFALGPSHTLPTARAARFASPVNVLTFMKLTSMSHLQAKDLMELLPTIEAFGEMEGFPAHARDAAIRFEAD